MIKKIAKALLIDENKIYQILNNVELFYERIKIKRHHKKPRIVYKPLFPLNEIQSYLLTKIIKTYKVSKFSGAYEKKCSTIKTLNKHKNKNHYLVIDIESFYDNITYSHFYQLLHKHYKEEDIITMWKLVSINNRLPLGTSVSPFIANRIMYDIDIKINKRLKKITYTRYADDLIFSSKKYINKDLIDEIRMILKEYDFKINDKKTRFLGPNQSQKILGLIMNNKKPELGAKKRKELRSMVYNYLIKNEKNIYQIKGHLSYARMIEPKFINKLAKKYKKLGFARINI